MLWEFGSSAFECTTDDKCNLVVRFRGVDLRLLMFAEFLA